MQALGNSRWRGIAVKSSGVGREDLLHFFHGRHLDLANAFGADLVLGGQVMQRHAAGPVIVDLEPALFDDAAGTFVQAFQYWVKLTALLVPGAVLLVVWAGDSTPLRAGADRSL